MAIVDHGRVIRQGPIDELIRESSLPAGLVLTVLLELELAGRIERQAGHRVALVGKPFRDKDKSEVA